MTNLTQRRQVRWHYSCGCTGMGWWVWPDEPVLGVSVGPCDKHGDTDIRVVKVEYL